MEEIGVSLGIGMIKYAEGRIAAVTPRQMPAPTHAVKEIVEIDSLRFQFTEFFVVQKAVDG